jgi:molybdopterin/thiamine biosynthesis adenylyltransferase/rhodanese-related sulfurtransferase
MFSPAEKNRYSRHFSLPGFGIESQEKLKLARVLVVGAGALGSPVLLYLAAAGIGKIGVVDGDLVEDSNLHRQVLYTTQDIGAPKARIAAEKLRDANPFVDVEVFETFISTENAFKIAENYDIIVDGTDNFPTRYLINDLCVLTGKINVHASILQFSGQISVFNVQLENGSRGPNYRDLYPNPPHPDDVVSCADGGVIGALPGILGSMQALEVIKLVTGIGNPLSGKLWIFDTLLNTSQIITFDSDINNPLTGSNPTIDALIDYDYFCGIKTQIMKAVSVQELKDLLDQKADIQLIDVREPFENEICTLNGILIPMNEVPARIDEISKDKQVVIHCRSGKRSGNIVEFLEQQYGYENLYNLTGGILAWAAEIDPTMEQY